MVLSILARFGRWVLIRDNLLIFSTICVGGPLSLSVILLIDWRSEPAIALMFVCFGLIVGLIWGMLMYELVGRPAVKRMQALEAARKESK